MRTAKQVCLDEPKVGSFAGLSNTLPVTLSSCSSYLNTCATMCGEEHMLCYSCGGRVHSLTILNLQREQGGWYKMCH